MMTGRDAEVFRQLATSFVLRGISNWSRGEIGVRIQRLRLGLHQDTDVALIAICRTGWLEELPADRFSLTELGKIEARQLIGPTMAGDREL